MKLNISKLTSFTLLTSMVLSAVSPPVLPVVAFESESEMYMEESMTVLEDTENGQAAETMEPMEESGFMIPQTEQQEPEPATDAYYYEPETSQPETKAEENREVSEGFPEQQTGMETQVTETESQLNIEESVQVQLELVPSDLQADGKDPYQAGYPQKLKITALNKSDQDAALKLYFWEYEGSETDEKLIPDEILTKPCEDVIFPVGDDQGYFTVLMQGEDGAVIHEEFYLQEKEAEGQLSERYLEVSLPAGHELNSIFPVMNDTAEKLVVDPVISIADRELKFDKCVITWNEKIEEETENMPESESNMEQEETELIEELQMETDLEEQESVIEIPETENESESEIILLDTEVNETTENVSEESVWNEDVHTEDISDPEETNPVEEGELISIPSDLNKEDFVSRRLLVMVEDEKMIKASDTVIDTFDNIYLLAYDSVEKCMAAYVYYMDIADAVGPDVYMEIASDEKAKSPDYEEKESIVAKALSSLEGAFFPSDGDGKTRVIALLDTGVSASENVIERVSLIDETLEGHTHGNSMAKAIIGQNPNAQIMSVRVMGNNGRGTVSAIVAGMEYAIEHGASIINLSLSSKKNAINEVLEAEIRKAVEKGIIVVGAAGNNASDASGYMPGSVEDAYIIGACNESGIRNSTSNYGASVDYNVIAGTTSEAAAKFSGCISRSGIEGIRINEGIIYKTDYIPTYPEHIVTDRKEEEDDYSLAEDELYDMAGSEEDGPYPGKGSSISMSENIWSRDTSFNFSTYNPYEDDENVLVSCVSDELPETCISGDRVDAEYICSLKDDVSYRWHLFVTFQVIDDRSLATEGSIMLEKLMPSIVNQERNAGYGGIVPDYVGATVEGRTFTVLKDNTDFDINGLLIDYNPETFKVNRVIDDGRFDVSTAGSYIVTYEMSYFLYPEYTWFVTNRVDVVDRSSLENGVYLMTRESTLMFRSDGDNHYFGYGDLVMVDFSGKEYTIRCIDPEYDVQFDSSSDTITSDICSLEPQEDGTTALQVMIPENISEPVILTMFRPGYESAKFFTAGGWADGDEHNIEEFSVEQLSDKEMLQLEETVLGKVDEDDESYMEIAATWTTVESKSISGSVKTGSANSTNYSWVSGSMGACSSGTAQITDKKTAISNWITDKGYNVDISSLSNFSVNCSSGHDYLGLWPNTTYSATFKCEIQKSGSNYRLKISCSLHPSSDSHGNYQSFYGSKTYSSVTSGARLRVHKRFKDPDFFNVNPDHYGYLKTTFAIYPASAYNKTTKTIDPSAEPVSTIILNDQEDVSVYGDSDLLDTGTYYVMETRRIKGCTLNTDVYGPVVIKDSDSGVVKLYERIDCSAYDSIGSNNWIYNYPMYFNGKILTKVDDAGLPVAGAIYKVEYSSATTASAFSPLKTWYFKTDSTGKLAYGFENYVSSFTYKGKTYKSDELIISHSGSYTMLPFGFVRIKEIMPPSDIYTIDTNTYVIELVANKDSAGEYTIRKLIVKGNIPVSVDRKNPPETETEPPETEPPETEPPQTEEPEKYWKLTLVKASKANSDILNLNKYSLQGASFGLFSDAGCYNRVQLYTNEAMTVAASGNVLLTNALGKTPVYYVRGDSGTRTYYVKELSAPSGHSLVNSVLPVTVSMPYDNYGLKTVSFTGNYSEPYDYMDLDLLVEKLSMHGNPIQGVVFKVCYYDDSSANAGNLRKTWYLASDENGKVYMDQSHVYSGDSSMRSDSFYTDSETGKVILPVGGFVTMQEVKAPAQYVMDDTVRSFTTKKQTVSMERIYNQLVPCQIRLKKYDSTGSRTLSGVQFELKFVKATEKDTSLAGQYGRLLKEGETQNFITDENGEIIFDNLDHGTYEITEVKTVPGQTLLKDKITVELPITMTKAEADAYGNVDFSSAKEDKGYTNKWFFYSCLYEITNEPQFSIPQTGGFGTWFYGYTGIAALILAGVIYMIASRRKAK